MVEKLKPKGGKLVKVKNALLRFLIAMPAIVLVACGLGSVVSADYSGVLIAGWGIMVTILNHLFKMFAKKLGGQKLGKRPNPCGMKVNNKCGGCGIFDEGVKSKTWGMPSGHAQFSIWIATFVTMWCVGRAKIGDQEEGDLGWQLPIIWLLAISVCIQRSPWVSGCHSFLQLFIGGIIGAGLGVGTYAISTKISEERFPTAW